MRAIAAADLQSSQHRPQAAQSLQKSMLQPVQGLILDSAPCRLSPDISARLAKHFEHMTSVTSRVRKQTMCSGRAFGSDFGMQLSALMVQHVACK